MLKAQAKSAMKKKETERAAGARGRAQSDDTMHVRADDGPKRCVSALHARSGWAETGRGNPARRGPTPAPPLRVGPVSDHFKHGREDGLPAGEVRRRAGRRRRHRSEYVWEKPRRRGRERERERERDKESALH